MFKLRIIIYIGYGNVDKTDRVASVPKSLAVMAVETPVPPPPMTNILPESCMKINEKLFQ